MTETKTIPLCDLVHDEAANAGHEKRMTQIGDLLASIPAHGIIQSLRVRPIRVPGKGHDKVHAVIAGNRRLAALKQLAADGTIAENFPVPVIVSKEDDKAAHELSAAENIERLPMSPVEEFQAYAQLRDDGRTPEAIALRFGVPERRVQQRLRLAGLHPDVVAALDAGEITLDAAAAFTVQPDPELQRQHLEQARNNQQPWNLQAGNIRRAMTSEQVGGQSELAKLIGEDAYLAAGGEIITDLFGDDSWWVSDDILKQLVAAHWEGATQAWLAEGWAFVAPAGEYGQRDYGGSRAHDLRRLYAVPVAAPAETVAEIARLEEKIDELIQSSGLDPEEDEELEEKIERFESELMDLRKTERAFTAEQKAGSGVVYFEDGSQVLLGVVDPKKVAAPAEAGGAGAGAEPAKPKGDLERPGDLVSGHLAEKLTEALQSKVGQDPELALQICVATLHAQMRCRGRFPPLHLDGKAYHSASDVEPPQGATFDGALAWAAKQDREALLTYLAQLVAENIDVRMNGPAGGYGISRRALIDFVDPDTLPCFEPEHFFNNVTKPVIALAFEQMTGLKLKEGKKAEMAATASARASELGWLPLQLRTPSYAGPGVTSIEPEAAGDVVEADESARVAAE